MSVNRNASATTSAFIDQYLILGYSRYYDTRIAAAGYCFPHGFRDDTTASADTAMIGTVNQPAKPPWLLMGKRRMLASETGMEVISAIPCYCDIQFSRKEFLTVLNRPRHPFTKQFEAEDHTLFSSLFPLIFLALYLRKELISKLLLLLGHDKFVE